MKKTAETASVPPPTLLTSRILAWYHDHGRQRLPWRTQITPYRVWIAEIMLQQTQVATATGYFERFLVAFPALEHLAAAPLDQVLHRWSGLGYYARARNLHRTARLLVEQHQGCFPTTVEQLAALPGIGRSTAGAILSIALGVRAPILDGNVKRLLSRLHGVEGWSGERSVEQRLWQLAEAHTPATAFSDYTQAVMDLGALVCTRARPHCDACPVAQQCVARQQGRTAELPTPRPRRSVPVRELTWLLLRNASQSLLLEQRPATGVWGGLWAFPESAIDVDIDHEVQARWGFSVMAVTPLPHFEHLFTHLRLRVRPQPIDVALADDALLHQGVRWCNIQQPCRVGLAAPVTRLLRQLQPLIGEVRMTRMVFCRKYKREMEGLDAPPYPGPRGEAIYQQVSKQAWQEWLAHQTRLINERRLNMMESASRKFLQEEMERFLSGEALTAVEGYVQPER